jgi:hypothetical protein
MLSLEVASLPKGSFDDRLTQKGFGKPSQVISSLGIIALWVGQRFAAPFVP